MKRKLIVSVVIILAFSLVTGDYATTNTANDLLKLYGYSTKESYSDVKREFDEAEKAYFSAKSSVDSARALNVSIDFAESELSKKRSEVYSAIEVLRLRNIAIQTQMADNLLSLTSSEVVALDSEYKINREHMFYLQDIIGDYSTVEYVETKTYVYDEAYETYKYLGEKLAAAEKIESLGSVYSINYKLNGILKKNSSFGLRIHPVTKIPGVFHSGIDLSARQGTKVPSLFNGVVSSVGYSTGGGNYVRVDHGHGIVSFYCHLSSVKCNVGQVVKQYETIALSGNTGSSTTGAHLHLSLYIRGNPVDPAKLLFR